MDDPAEHVVIPYERFLERLRRRQPDGTDPKRPEPPTTDADVPPVPDHPPVTSSAWRAL